MTTIYKYTNRINRKVYVGKTDRALVTRHNEHKYTSKIGDTHWANALKKWGIESFDLETLCEVPTADGAFVEMLFIEVLDSTNKKFGYKSTDGGEGLLGFKHSDETKAGIKKSLTGRMGWFHYHPIYGKQDRAITIKILRTKYGPDYIPKGPKPPNRTPEQLFESAQAGWVKRKQNAKTNNPDGRVHTPASRLKMSQSHKGRKQKPRALKLICKRNHPQTPENIYVYKNKKQCLLCRREYKKEQ